MKMKKKKGLRGKASANKLDNNLDHEMMKMKHYFISLVILIMVRRKEEETLDFATVLTVSVKLVKSVGLCTTI